jgi:plastocyanin
MVNIAVGDTVHWVWADPVVAHTVTSGTPGAPDGKFCSLPQGSAVSADACRSVAYAQVSPFTYDFTFTMAGSFPYYCTVHGAAQTGMVTVR